jgi:hypothetical protein
MTTEASPFLRPPLRRGAALRTPDGPIASRFVVAVGAVGYVVVLHFIYQHVIAPYFTYMGYAYRRPDPAAYAAAITLVVTLALILPRRITRPSHFVAWVLFVVTIIPSIIVPQIADLLPRDESLVIALWVALSYLPVAVLGTRQAIRGVVPRLRMSPAAFWTGALVISVAAYAYVIAVAGVRWELPSLDDVYGLRDEFTTEKADSALLRYVVPLLTYVLNPLIIARGLLRGPWALVVAGIIGQFFVYSVTGYKAAVLSPLAIVLAGWVLFRRRSRPAASTVLIGVVVLIFVAWGLDWLSSSTAYTSMLVRRLLLTPGFLTAAYVSVFSDIDKVAFSHSFLSSFSQYPYAAEPSELVGAQFYSRPGTHANASFLADGYANLGYPGMLLEGLVLAVLLCLIDDACRGLSVRVGSLLLVMEALALASSGVFTVMLTHGLVATILVCAMVPRVGWARRREHAGGRAGGAEPRAGPNRSRA